MSGCGSTHHEGCHMPPILGFSTDQAQQITQMVQKLRDQGFDLSPLAVIHYQPMADYHGLVEPEFAKGMIQARVLISSFKPFTLAHELAHVADMALRPIETKKQIGLKESDHWHLAHRMSSEYLANHIASQCVDEADSLDAFKGDYRGLIHAYENQDWAMFCVNYALVLGLFHGLGRFDCDPAANLDLPASLKEILEDFAIQAPEYLKQFDNVKMAA